MRTHVRMEKANNVLLLRKSFEFMDTKQGSQQPPGVPKQHFGETEEEDLQRLR